MALSVTYISASSFSIANNSTDLFRTGRKIRAVCGTGYKYGYVDYALFDGTMTTVYLVSSESDSLDISLTSVDVSVLKSSNSNDSNVPLEYVWLLRGQQTIEIQYKNTTILTLRPGIIHIDNGISERVYHCNGFDKQIIETNPFEWRYIYIQPPVNGNEITANEVHHTTTLPYSNSGKQGYYHPINTNWRCIGIIRIGSNGIVGFNIDGIYWKSFANIGNDINNLQPSTTWTDVTFSSAPLGNLTIQGLIQFTPAATAAAMYRRKGSNDDGIYVNSLQSQTVTSMFDFQIDSNKQGQFKFGTATSSGIYFMFYGYIIPREMYNGVSGNSTSLPTVFDVASRGMQSISVEYKDPTSIYLNPGVCHIWGNFKEDIYQLTSQISINLTGLTPSTWYAIYVSPSTTNDINSTDVQYSSVMPTRNLTKMGWYHPINTSWRCIGFIYNSVSNGITAFVISGGSEYIWTDSNISIIPYASYSSSSWTDITTIIPIGGLLAIVIGWSSAATIVYTRPKGSNGAGWEWVPYQTQIPTKFLTDANKIFQIKPYTTMNLQGASLGFVLPDLIYTGPAGGLTRTVNSAFDITKNGHQAGLGIVYKDSNSFYVKAGSIHLNNGSTDRVYSLESQISKSVIGLTANVWYAIYVKVPSSGTIITSSEIEYSTIMPYEDQSKGGWYHTSNAGWRCIGFFRTDSTPTIIPFDIVGDRYTFSDSYIDEGSTIPSTTWTTITGTVPIGSIAVLIRVSPQGGTVMSLLVRKKGLSGSGFITAIAGGYESSPYTIPVDSNKQFEVKFPSSNGCTVYFSTFGFVIPSGIGSGAASVGRSLTQSFDITKVGFKRGLQLVYSNTSTFLVKAGTIHLSDNSMDNLYIIQSQLTKTVTGLAVSTWYAVYVQIPVNSTVITSNEIQYSTVMPIEDQNRQGWYHPLNNSWRCIGFFMSNESGNICEFRISNDFFKFVVNINDLPWNTTLPTTGTDVILSVPIPVTAIVNCTFRSTSGLTYFYIKEKGTSSGVCLGYSTGSTVYSHGSAFIMTDTSKEVTLYSDVSTIAGELFLEGFIIPSGI